MTEKNQWMGLKCQTCDVFHNRFDPHREGSWCGVDFKDNRLWQCGKCVKAEKDKYPSKNKKPQETFVEGS